MLDYTEDTFTHRWYHHLLLPPIIGAIRSIQNTFLMDWIAIVSGRAAWSSKVRCHTEARFDINYDLTPFLAAIETANHQARAQFSASFDRALTQLNTMLEARLVMCACAVILLTLATYFLLPFVMPLFMTGSTLTAMSITAGISAVFIIACTVGILAYATLNLLPPRWRIATETALLHPIDSLASLVSPMLQALLTSSKKHNGMHEDNFPRFLLSSASYNERRSAVNPSTDNPAASNPGWYFYNSSSDDSNSSSDEEAYGFDVELEEVPSSESDDEMNPQPPPGG